MRAKRLQVPDAAFAHLPPVLISREHMWADKLTSATCPVRTWQGSTSDACGDRTKQQDQPSIDGQPACFNPSTIGNIFLLQLGSIQWADSVVTRRLRSQAAHRDSTRATYLTVDMVPAQLPTPRPLENQASYSPRIHTHNSPRHSLAGSPRALTSATNIWEDASNASDPRTSPVQSPEVLQVN